MSSCCNLDPAVVALTTNAGDKELKLLEATKTLMYSCILCKGPVIILREGAHVSPTTTARASRNYHAIIRIYQNGS